MCCNVFTIKVDLGRLANATTQSFILIGAWVHSLFVWPWALILGIVVLEE
jgi:hypothetical protein